MGQTSLLYPLSTLKARVQAHVNMQESTLKHSFGINERLKVF